LRACVSVDEAYVLAIGNAEAIVRVRKELVCFWVSFWPTATAIDRLIVVLMRSLHGLLYIPAATSARVDKSFANEMPHRFTISSYAFALTHLSVPIDSQPTEILSHCLCEIRPRALRIEILITKPQQSSGSTGTLSCDPKRPRVSKMQ
jgi:hypothetical protein